MTDAAGCAASNTVEVIGEPFAALDKELNGEYYKLSTNNQLYFRYEGQYDFSNFTYNVYDGSHSVISSNTSNNHLSALSLYQVSSTSGFPNPSLYSVFPGDNHYAFDASSLNAGYYILEVINEKKEKTYLRFKR
jgi:hypothetical protein